MPKRTESNELREVRRLAGMRDRANAQLPAAIAAAKAKGEPVEAIAKAAGFSTRRSVYQLLKRHGLD